MQATVLKSTAFLLVASVFLFAAGPLPAQTTSGSGDAALRAKIAELEGALRKLQAENALLRKQLAEPKTTKPAETPTKVLPDGVRWISSTGKRHNAACRYYGKGEGRDAKRGEGVPCKICGG